MSLLTLSAKVLEAHFAGVLAVGAATAAASISGMTVAELMIPDWRHLGMHAIAGVCGCVVLVANTDTGKTAAGVVTLLASSAIMGAFVGPAVTEGTGQPYLGIAAAGGAGYSLLNFVANPSGWLQKGAEGLIDWLLREKK